MALSRSRNVAAVVLVVALAIGGGAWVLAQEGNARVSVSTIAFVDGDVVVGHGTQVIAAREGSVVAEGDTVLAAPGASALLTYFDGSSINVASGGHIVVGSLSAEPDRGAVVTTMRIATRFWHVITRLLSGGSRYDDRAPSSTASVRG